MITVSEAAQFKIIDLLAEENIPNLKLRTYVQGGGCSGFSYGFIFEQEQNEDDFEFPVGNFKLVVDAMSMQYLEGAEIDYQDELYGSSFVIRNPNAVTSCSCGSSFSV